MVKRLLLHLALFILVLVGLWYGLSRISVRKVFNVDQRLEKMEEQLGNWTIRFFKNENTLIQNAQVDSLIYQFTHHLEKGNSFSNKPFEIYIFENEEVNAFALPGNTIVIYTGLIEFTKSAEELAGIMAHEIAHIENDHVIKKLGKEIGLGALFSLISGSYNLDVIKEVAKTLSSAAYDRGLESEADELALEYLINARISPQGYIGLLERFSEELPGLPGGMEWISTHPDSFERANTLKNLLHEKGIIEYKNTDSLSQSWQELSDIINSDN